MFVAYAFILKNSTHLRKPPFGLEVVFRRNLEFLEIQIFGKLLSSLSNNCIIDRFFTRRVHHAFINGNLWKNPSLPTLLTSGKSSKRFKLLIDLRLPMNRYLTPSIWVELMTHRPF